MRPEAVLCDVDGVVRIYDHDGLADLERAEGLEPGTMPRIAFDARLLAKLTTCGITDQQWRAEVASVLTREHPGADADRLLAVFSAPRIDERVLDLLSKVRRRVPVWLVTNGTDATESQLAELGVTPHVDGVVNSARVGVAKPNPRILQIAVELVGVAPDRCLFIDDSAANVRAARARHDRRRLSRVRRHTPGLRRHRGPELAVIRVEFIPEIGMNSTLIKREHWHAPRMHGCRNPEPELRKARRA